MTDARRPATAEGSKSMPPPAAEEIERVTLALRTWPEVEAYLRGSNGVVVPVGSTEQHGPSGALGTDAICAELVASALGVRAGALVGPAISVGMAQHHLAFPGTVSLRPSTLMRVVEDYVASLARGGFARFYFVNGHGGNVATVRAAFDEIYARASMAGAPGAIRCRLVNWWDPKPVAALCERLFGARDGEHATPSEISLAALARPSTLRPSQPEGVGPPARAAADAADFRRLFPDGRVGSDPSLASAGHGRELLDAITRELAADYAEFLRA